MKKQSDDSRKRLQEVLLNNKITSNFKWIILSIILFSLSIINIYPSTFKFLNETFNLIISIILMLISFNVFAMSFLDIKKANTINFQLNKNNKLYIEGLNKLKHISNVVIGIFVFGLIIITPFILNTSFNLKSYVSSFPVYITIALTITFAFIICNCLYYFTLAKKVDKDIKTKLFYYIYHYEPLIVFGIITLFYLNEKTNQYFILAFLAIFIVTNIIKIILKREIIDNILLILVGLLALLHVYFRYNVHRFDEYLLSIVLFISSIFTIGYFAYHLVKRRNELEGFIINILYVIVCLTSFFGIKSVTYVSNKPNYHWINLSPNYNCILLIYIFIGFLVKIVFDFKKFKLDKSN